MKYKCTLLKETPEFPVGTTFIAEVAKGYRGAKNGTLEFYYNCFNHSCLAKLVDDPKWIKKEVAYDTCMDVKCEKCGETRGWLDFNAYQAGDRYDGYYNTCDIYFEYACGHGKRNLKR